MQGTTMGSASSLGQRRSLESEGGRAMRMARKLERQGFSGAAQQMALAGAQAKLSEPALKTQAYREKAAQMGALAQSQTEAAEEEKRQTLAFLKRAREQGSRELDNGGLTPATATLFGSLYKK